MKRKRLNVWRRAGRFEFRRETGRYYDGTPNGTETLYIRIKGVGCVYSQLTLIGEGPLGGPGEAFGPGAVWHNDGLSFRAPAIEAAKRYRRILLRKLSER